MLRPVLPMDNPASLLAALQHRLYHQTPNRRGLAGFFVKSLAVLLAVIRDLAFGQLTLRATSLVYTTLLSIVPMLALTFSVSTAFGVRGQIEPALARFMEPLGPRGQEITTNIMNFINNMNVGVLGSVGLGMLLFTAVSTILKIEASINTIWHVKQMRSISQRISGYLCILLLGPILVFSALGLNATLASSHLVQMIISVEPFGHLAVLAGRLLPYVLVILLFLFLYLFMPNTRVRFMPALTSALVAGVCWQSAGWGFARFVAGSSQYTAIYSSLAIIIIFMIWLYVSWLVVLVGASVGFYMQHTECLMAPPGEEPHLSAQSQDQLALAIMQALGERYLQGNAALRTEELAKRFHTPGYAIDGHRRAGGQERAGGLDARPRPEQHHALAGAGGRAPCRRHPSARTGCRPHHPDLRLRPGPDVGGTVDHQFPRPAHPAAAGPSAGAQQHGTWHRQRPAHGTRWRRRDGRHQGGTALTGHWRQPGRRGGWGGPAQHRPAPGRAAAA